jgi:hypothetical protein
VMMGDRLLVLGLGLLALSITSSVLLTLDVVLGRPWAVIGASVTALVALLTWYALPLRIRRRGHGLAPDPAPATGPDHG